MENDVSNTSAEQGPNSEPESLSDKSSTEELPEVEPKPKAVLKSIQIPKAKSKSSYKNMILDAVSTLDEKKGSSRQAIVKYITENYDVGKEKSFSMKRISISLVQMVESGDLLHPSGKGAVGSFKMPSKKTQKKTKDDEKTLSKDKSKDEAETKSKSDEAAKPKEKKPSLMLKPKPVLKNKKLVMTQMSAKKSTKRNAAKSKVSSASGDESHGENVPVEKTSKTKEIPAKKVVKPKKTVTADPSTEDKATTSPKKATTKSKGKAAKSTKETVAEVNSEDVNDTKSPKKAVAKKIPKNAAAKISPKKPAPNKTKSAPSKKAAGTTKKTTEKKD